MPQQREELCLKVTGNAEAELRKIAQNTRTLNQALGHLERAQRGVDEQFRRGEIDEKKYRQETERNTTVHRDLSRQLENLRGRQRATRREYRRGEQQTRRNITTNRNLYRTIAGSDGLIGAFNRFGFTLFITRSSLQLISAPIIALIDNIGQNEQALFRLQNAYAQANRFGNDFGFSLTGITETVREYGEATRFGFRQTAQLGAELLSVGRILEGVDFRQALEAAGAISVATGRDVNANDFRQDIIRLFTQPNEEARLLGALIPFTFSERENLRNLVEANRAGEAFNLLLQRIRETFGDIARLDVNTLTGSLQQLRNTFLELFQISPERSRALVESVQGLTATLSLPSTQRAFTLFLEFVTNTVSSVIDFGSGAIRAGGLSVARDATIIGGGAALATAGIQRLLRSNIVEHEVFLAVTGSHRFQTLFGSAALGYLANNTVALATVVAGVLAHVEAARRIATDDGTLGRRFQAAYGFGGVDLPEFEAERRRRALQPGREGALTPGQIEYYDRAFDPRRDLFAERLGRASTGARDFTEVLEQLTEAFDDAAAAVRAFQSPFRFGQPNIIGRRADGTPVFNFETPTGRIGITEALRRTAARGRGAGRAPIVPPSGTTDISEAQFAIDARASQSQFELFGQNYVFLQESAEEYRLEQERLARETLQAAARLTTASEQARGFATALDAIGNRLPNLIAYTDNWGRALFSLAQTLLNQINQIYGLGGPTLLGDLFRVGVAAVGGAFGGGTRLPIGGAGVNNFANFNRDAFLNLVPRFQEGGLLRAGRAGIVGEAGAELIVPANDSRIISNDRAFGAPPVNMTVNINAEGADPAALERVLIAVARLEKTLPDRVVGTVKRARFQRTLRR